MAQKIIKDNIQENTEYNLEQLFEQAEDIISRLEQPDLSLEDAFLAYEQGMKVIKNCNEKIDIVEKKMLMMSGDGELETFEGVQ